MTPPLVVAVLAGGDGRRMGGGKPLRVLARKTLIERAVEQARQWSSLVAVSVRTEDQAGAVDAVEILDAEEAGPIAGLASALRFARQAGAERLLTIACDMPLLPVDLAARMEEALMAELGAVVASSGGVLHPVCGLWRCSALDALPRYRASGRSSLKAFAAELGRAVADWPVEPYDPFLNVNNPDDLGAAETLLRRLKSR